MSQVFNTCRRKWNFCSWWWGNGKTHIYSAKYELGDCIEEQAIPILLVMRDFYI